VNHPQSRFFRWLQALPRPLLGSGIAVLLTGIWLLDYLIRIDLGLSVFYVLPIALTTWFFKPKAGYGISLLGAILWLIAERSRLPPDTVHQLLLWNTLVRLSFFVIVVRLLAELQMAYWREQRLAQTDSLTKLLNRRAFWEALEAEVLRSQRHQYGFTLAYLDVDNFKQVNDRFGHAAGDRLLQALAVALTHQLREVDIIARLGGDEFAVLLIQTDLREASIALHRLFEHLSQMDGLMDAAGISVGAVTFAHPPLSADCALAIADELMYSVKRSGKNQLIHREV